MPGTSFRTSLRCRSPSSDLPNMTWFSWFRLFWKKASPVSSVEEVHGACPGGSSDVLSLEVDLGSQVECFPWDELYEEVLTVEDFLAEEDGLEVSEESSCASAPEPPLPFGAGILREAYLSHQLRENLLLRSGRDRRTGGSWISVAPVVGDGSKVPELRMVLSSDHVLYIERPGALYRRYQVHVSRPCGYRWTGGVPRAKGKPPLRQGGGLRLLPLHGVLAYWAGAPLRDPMIRRVADALWNEVWVLIHRRMERSARDLAQRYRLSWENYVLLKRRPDLQDLVRQLGGAADWIQEVPSGVPLRDVIAIWGEAALGKMCGWYGWNSLSVSVLLLNFRHPAFLRWVRTVPNDPKVFPSEMRRGNSGYHSGRHPAFCVARAAQTGLVDVNYLRNLTTSEHWLLFHLCVFERRYYCLLPSILRNPGAAVRAIEDLRAPGDFCGHSTLYREVLRRIIDWQHGVLSGTSGFSMKELREWERLSEFPVSGDLIFPHKVNETLAIPGFVRRLEEAERWHRTVPRQIRQEEPRSDSVQDDDALGIGSLAPFSVTPPFTCHEERGLRIQWLNSFAAIEEESQRLGHCVGWGGYHEVAAAGFCFLYSIESLLTGQPLFTVEVDTFGRILQAEGTERRRPHRTLHTWLEQLFRQYWTSAV